MTGYKAFEELRSDCKICLINPETYGRMKKCLQQMIDQGLVQIAYTKKVKYVLAKESQGHTPFEIPYQQIRVSVPVQISVTMSSQTSIQIPVPIPIQIPFHIPAKSEDPIVFHVPALFPFETTKFVPWNYNATIYVGEKHIVLEPASTNIIDIWVMTRSGRVFILKRQQNGKTSESSKWK